MNLNINEIFYSIQGEGVHQGLPTVFIRLQGCNLYPDKCCSYCDTRYAQKYKGGESLSIDRIVSEVIKLSPEVDTKVCLTGGEPLFQDIEELVGELSLRNYFIEVFTNGTCSRPRWWTRVSSWVTDVKCPSSGVFLFQDGWLDGRVTDQIKLTVADKRDLEFASTVIARCAVRNAQVVVSPVINLSEGGVETGWLREVAEFCLSKRVRFSLQWHKVLWGNKRGV